MALWAFCLGYIVSSMIQVLVSRERMRRTMGDRGARAVALGAFFGFISTSCSFAALSTTRALFQKGAGLAASLAFLLASTNLVIELGIVIFIFLSWQFVVAEYIGGVLLVLVTWLLVSLVVPKGLIDKAREHAERFSGGDEGEVPDWMRLAKSREGWQRIGRRYTMEWGMVWKDVLFGFTVAGVIAAFVPPEFFRMLFVGTGAEGGPAWWQIALHTLIGPVAAFFTFIGSMGNIPLAAVLFGSGVSFAGIMAFIFSDLVVFPVLRIAARYFGLRMALAILGMFLVSLVVSALVMHFGFSAAGLLPESESAKASQVAPSERFKLDYTFYLNVAFLAVSAVLGRLAWSKIRAERAEQTRRSDNGGGSDWVERMMRVLAVASVVWLVGGLVVWGIGGFGAVAQDQESRQAASQVEIRGSCPAGPTARNRGPRPLSFHT